MTVIKQQKSLLFGPESLPSSSCFKKRVSVDGCCKTNGQVAVFFLRYDLHFDLADGTVHKNKLPRLILC